MLASAEVRRAIGSGQQLLTHLERMETELSPQTNPTMRWVVLHRETVERWVAALEQVQTRVDLDRLWGAIQQISLVLDCALDGDLGERYRRLQSGFSRDVAEAVAAARSGFG